MHCLSRNVFCLFSLEISLAGNSRQLIRWGHVDYLGGEGEGRQRTAVEGMLPVVSKGLGLTLKGVKWYRTCLLERISSSSMEDRLRMCWCETWDMKQRKENKFQKSSLLLPSCFVALAGPFCFESVTGNCFKKSDSKNTKREAAWIILRAQMMVAWSSVSAAALLRSDQIQGKIGRQSYWVWEKGSQD